MIEPDPQVLEGILALLREAQGDWEYDGEIGPDTRFVADLGLESLEIVVLSTMVQQQYGRLPFPQFFDEIGQRPVEERDISVAELAGFVCEHRQPNPLEV
ncbi:MAG TPA: phosphopantetheine-binding protein [Solirubrobacteraceae bacterium]|nr:phosphopantetheine-binding protein [Solirubrobacteraceae bacterium]